MKLRSSTKIATGFVIIALVAYFGYGFVTDRIVASRKFPLLQPGDVNLVGVDAGRGYRIQVSNHTAQLVQSTNAEFQETDNASGEGPTSGVDAKRVPVDDMLRAMQGNTQSLGNFVAIMNDKQENDDWPTTHVVWTAEKLRQALDGDKALEAQLVKDINVELDGTPIPEVRRSSINNGIVIDAPVPVRVMVGNEAKTLIARLQTPYRPQLARAVEGDLKNKERITPEMIEGYYSQEAKKLQEEPATKEDVRRTLTSMISPTSLASYATVPERLLKSAKVVVNDQFIKGASYEEIDGPQGRKLYNMNISLTDEGRMRLWQYSKQPGHPQLLLTVNGSAIAAPRVAHELAQSELTITQLPDEWLVKDAVDAINQKTRAK